MYSNNIYTQTHFHSQNNIYLYLYTLNNRSIYIGIALKAKCKQVSYNLYFQFESKLRLVIKFLNLKATQSSCFSYFN